VGGLERKEGWEKSDQRGGWGGSEEKEEERNERGSQRVPERAQRNGRRIGPEAKERRGGCQFDTSRGGKRKEGSGRTNEESDASVHHRPEQSFPVSVSFSVRVPEMRLVLSDL